MAEKLLSTRCSNDHSHTRLEGREQVQIAQMWPAKLTQAFVKTIGKVLSESIHHISGNPGNADGIEDEVAAVSMARAFAPRASRTRASFLRGPRKHPTTKKELHTEVTSSKRALLRHVRNTRYTRHRSRGTDHKRVRRTTVRTARNMQRPELKHHTVLMHCATGSLVLRPSIRRAWKKPQPRSQTSRQVPETFKDRVPADIMWPDGQPTVHVTDEATRYSQAVCSPSTSQNKVVVMETLSEIWSKVKPDAAGIKSENSGIILSRWAVQRVLLLEGRHAGIVERHHEIIRSLYRKIWDQMVAEGTGVSAGIMLSEAVHAHNILTTCKMRFFRPVMKH
eukprot:3034203-Amphidinium_carterae.1